MTPGQQEYADDLRLVRESEREAKIHGVPANIRDMIGKLAGRLDTWMLRCDGMEQANEGMARQNEQVETSLKSLRTLVARSKSLDMGRQTGPDGLTRLFDSEEIAQAVIAVTQVSWEDICSRSRNLVFARARQLYMWSCVKHGAEPYSVVARKCGGREHASVCIAKRNVSNSIKRDAQCWYSKKMDSVEGLLGIE